MRAGRCGHRPLRSPAGKPSVGAGVPDGPSWFCHAPSRQGTRALPYKVLRYRDRADRGIGLYKGMPCRAGPVCPAAHRTPCCVSLRGQCAHRCGDPYSPISGGLRAPRPTELCRKTVRRGRCPHRPGCRHFLFLPVGAGVPDGPSRFCTAPAAGPVRLGTLFSAKNIGLWRPASFFMSTRKIMQLFRGFSVYIMMWKTLWIMCITPFARLFIGGCPFVIRTGTA